MAEGTCPRCGTAVEPGQTSCGACGAVLAPRASMDGFSMFDKPAPPPAPAEPERRRGRGLLVAALVAVLVVAGSAGALALRGHRHHGYSAVPASPASSPTASGTSTHPPSASATPSTSPTPTPSAGPPIAHVRWRCWDGTVRRTLAACGSPYDGMDRPVHLSGLDWVFVDRAARLSAAHASCSDVGGQARTLHVECTLALAGSQVCLHYSQFTSATDALADYSRLSGSRDRVLPGGARVRTWPPQESGGCPGFTYKTARIVVGQRWGLSAYADDVSTATAALDRFGQFRDVRQWRGVRVSR